MKLLLTLFFLVSISGALRADVYVLCYHSFLGRENVAYDFSLDELKSHILFLKDRGFKFISIDELTRGVVRGKRNILITIDDGNHSVYDAYYKVFRPMGIKPLLGIYTFILGHRDYALTWDKLKKLSDDGCDIASHGFFHLKLNDRLYREQKKQFIQEIARSKSILEEKLQRKVAAFVYPFGLHSASAVETLKKSGYKHAFTIVNNPVHTPLSANSDPYRLPRYMLTRSLYQGSLNTIARLADSQDKKQVSSITSIYNASAVVASSGYKRSKIEKSELKQVRKASVRRDTGKAPKNDVRYGVAYAEENKAGKSRKKKEPSGQTQKRKTVKSDRKTAVTLSVDQQRRHIPLPVKKNEYDLAYHHSLSTPEKKEGYADTSSGIVKADTSFPDKSNPPHRISGKIKERWYNISAGVIEFYVSFIEVKIRKASQYLRLILGYLGSKAA